LEYKSPSHVTSKDGSLQQPSFEHPVCYTLQSTSITFSLFHSELKIYLFRKSYPPP